MASYQDLIAQKAALEKEQAELEKQIAETLRAERSGVINQIKSLMAEHGITVADLSAGKPGRPANSSSPAAGRKVAAKYRDPDTGQSWSGRGLQPKWLKAALSSGKKLEDFAL
jgi:DNA-binding protein H-NS